MADRLTPEQRRLNMSRIRCRDTKPEFAVRRALHSMGFRYRLHVGDLPGRPDLVLPKWRCVVQVHGCFWHGHGCALFRWPATRQEFWREKIAGNVRRDRRNEAELMERGWRLVTVWECALKGRLRLHEDEFRAALAESVRSAQSQCEISSHPERPPYEA